MKSNVPLLTALFSAAAIATAAAIFAAVYFAVYATEPDSKPAGDEEFELSTSFSDAAPADDGGKPGIGKIPHADETVSRRAPPVPDPDQDAEIRRLVGLLGDEVYKTRAEAERKLVAMGAIALPELDKAIEHPDPEVRWRAFEAAERIRERAR